MRRRTLLKTAGSAVALSALSTAASAETGCPERRSLRSLRRDDPADIVKTWREGIRTLKSLPDDDPRNWEHQVRIHGTSRRFINCEHGNWLFLAWHRAFLHYHEEIIREVTGNEAFALPYWNWLDNGSLPALFRRAPFTNSSRTPVNSLDDTISGRDQVEPALSDPNFHRAIGGWAGTQDREGYVRAGSGAFESPAHDYVHIRVGGDMATGKSPNDPSFWAHHSMMDRLWWEWNARGHPNPDDDRWLDWTFADHFVDRHGETVDITVEEALALPEQFYTYGTRVGGGAADVDPDTQTNTATVELDTPARRVLCENCSLGVDSGLSGAVDRSVVEPYITGQAGRVLVTARDIAMPKTGWFHGRVYVNPKSPNPGRGSPHYAGTYHLWIAPPEHPPQNQYVDVTPTLERLADAGKLGDTVEIVVEGEPLRGAGNTSPSTPVGELSLSVTQSRIDGDIEEF